MSTHLRFRALGFATVAVATIGLTARADETPGTTPKPKAQPSDAFAKQIDAYIARKLAKEGITPVPQADDAEFLRRVSLDIAGTMPDPAEVIAFLGDQDPEKRRKKIDELLAKPATARNWAEFWTDVMEGEATTKKREDQNKAQFRDWFAQQLEKDLPFDELTRQVLGAEGYLNENGAVGYLLSYTGMNNQPDPTALAATTARVFMGLQIECAQCHDHPFADWKRDEFMGLAAFFARAKLDRPKLEPTDKDGKPITRKDLEKLPEAERMKLIEEFKKKQNRAPYGIKEAERGEFYAEVQTVKNPGKGDAPPAPKKPTATPPSDKKGKGRLRELLKPAKPGEPEKYLVDPEFIVPALALRTSDKDKTASLRETLGKAITHEKNPFFAKNMANRVWGRLTGRPLVAPSEDLSDPTAPNDADLLELLAKGVKTLKYDHEQLVRAICLTEAYGRSSRLTSPSSNATVIDKDDPEAKKKLYKAELLYAQGVVRPIDARPLARSIIGAVTLGAKNLEDIVGDGRAQQALLVRFERLFGECNMDPKKYEETIPQALFLMNGQGTNRGGPLRAKIGGGGKRGGGTPPMVASPSGGIAQLLERFEDPRERITRIYLATVCRPPRKAELDDMLAFVKEAGGEGDAYEDVLWALVNSAEFRFNR